MDVEKPASKGHGFFGLFDWGKKSKKRLFVGSASSSLDPKNAGDGKDIDDSTTSTRSNSILEDAPSLKESSEHSCSSSVIDEEAQARRCPTVVARLMGLDSMPVASPSELNPMPSTAQQPFQTNNHDDFTGRSYVGSPHKMPGSPIDRFKMEALPPRLAKRTLSVAQYKLLSPMKNPNHISSRNAADIMEAASRIIRPGLENISSYRVHDVGHTNAARAYNPGEIIGVQQRSQKLNEALRKRDGPASFRPPSGKPLDGRSRSSEGTSSSRISQSNGCAPVGPKVKSGNRSSNVAQAMHAQGGMRKGSRKLETRRNPENSLVERNGLHQPKDNNQMGSTSSSSVLVPNNRRQNTMASKHKVNSNPANPSRQRSNIHQINASPRKAGAASTFAGNNTQGSRKMDLQPTARANVRNDSIAKAIPKPRRSQNRRMYSDTSQSSDSVNSDRSQRRIRHNIVIDEQSSFSTNKKKISTEIVSFTFTSPVDKSLHGVHSPNHSVEKQFIENLNAVSTSSNTSNTKLDVIDGDYLGLLLEQKLRELTSGVRSPYFNPAKGVKVHGTSTALEDTASACETSSIASTDYDRESMQSFNDGKATLPQTDLATKSGQSFQPAKYDRDVTDRAELEHLRQSPHSTWEASISMETCSSSESLRSANGTRVFSSIEGATTSDSTHFNKFLEADVSSEYSDTASSITVATAEIPRSESSSSCHMDYRQEVEFIREILNASSSCLERFGDSDILDPHLLEELNGNTRFLAGEDGKGYRLRRRLLFDCVSELLTVKCAYYFNAGYGSWFMGMAILQSLSAEEIHREMTSLKVAEEWMVDELVYREMSSPLGSWVDFKMDSYQAGGDIAAELLGSLIDEVVVDLLTSLFL
ncbi:hypothetical protein SEVIR_9G025000v4 [Setaria viridis]|uniref:DUF4378 domain-containing protein n=1 Tax=Setaria viridis TaxID=4556 RepID=A0A4V6D0B7_SETVI|nr:uncharacterized protein LOC117838199 [Setaria viridis]TKV90384.1 hypothetical protein SEVIR_9G025000v2 [Setaria viridis]TKV90385.1 hypothetical protein SEVIR_9G025000v2 [Setaria viridis]